MSFTEFLFGKKCTECEDRGLKVSCSDPGVLGGNSIIYSDGRVVLRTNESISECPAITGESTHKDVAQEVANKVERLKGKIDLYDLLRDSIDKGF